MRKSCAINIIIHPPDENNRQNLEKKVSRFHAEIIERRLSYSDLTVEQQATVIDKITDILKSTGI